MGTASKVMYKIANIFNWIFLVLGIILFICGICGAAGAIKNDGSMSPEDFAVAEKAGTSKGWDILFLVLGIVSEDLFYFLGGLFGLIARK